MNKRPIFNRLLWLMLALVLPFSAPAQRTQKRTGKTASQAAAAVSEVQTLRLDSKLMARRMPYRVVLPPGYGEQKNASRRYPVIYLLHGLTGHFDNWTDKTGLSRHAAQYNVLIVTPEGGDGWYTDSASAPNDRYETYITDELIPEIDKNFRTAADRDSRVMAGLSMGGYGALKFGLKYPEKFVLVGSFSGALAAASLNEKNASPWIAKTITGVYGDETSETRRANDIFRIVREMPAEKAKTLPFLYLDCGTEDFLAESNRDFMRLLVEKKIRHEYRQLPGAHDWNYWNAQVQEFLRLSERFLRREAKAKTN